MPAGRELESGQLPASACHPHAICAMPRADRVWDVMGKMDGVGDFEGIVARAQNDSEYAAGLRKVRRPAAGCSGARLAWHAVALLLQRCGTLWCLQRGGIRPPARPVPSLAPPEPAPYICPPCFLHRFCCTMCTRERH